MALTGGDVVRITLFQKFNAQDVLNTMFYRVEGPAVLSGAQVAEGWWNDVKATWRAVAPNLSHFSFERVLAEEIEGDLEYGEYLIPVGERNGTRVGAVGDTLPSFTAVGVKWSVATRQTRPGSKRFVPITEGDVNNNSQLSAELLALFNTLNVMLTANIEIGVLDAFDMVPIVYGPVLAPSVRDPDGRPAVVLNDITGFLINPYVTSQVSRKIGHGS